MYSMLDSRWYKAVGLLLLGEDGCLTLTPSLYQRSPNIRSPAVLIEAISPVISQTLRALYQEASGRKIISVGAMATSFKENSDGIKNVNSKERRYGRN